MGHVEEADSSIYEIQKRNVEHDIWYMIARTDALSYAEMIVLALNFSKEGEFRFIKI